MTNNEMPFHLSTLNIEALDLLRYYGRVDTTASYTTQAIMDGARMSERAVRKGVRRLINKKLLNMPEAEVYKLTEPGRLAVAELMEWDMGAPFRPASTTRQITRRLVVAAPRQIMAGMTARVRVGFDEPDDEDVLPDPVDLLVRLTAIDGEAENVTIIEKAYRLTNGVGAQVFNVEGGAYTLIRVRVQVLQPEVYEEESNGLYFDLPVTDSPDAVLSPVAYSAAVQIQVEQ